MALHSYSWFSRWIRKGFKKAASAFPALLRN